MRYRVTLTNSILGSLILSKEPVGLKDIAPTIKRGENHGLTTEIDVKLQFYCNGAGKEFIDQVRDEQGPRAIININIDASCGCDPGDDAPDYSIDYSDDYGSATQGDCDYDEFYIGVIELKTWETDGEFTNCTIRPAGILETVKNRLDTKVDLFALETLDGTALSAFIYGPYELNLHSKTIIYKSDFNFLPDETHYPDVPLGWERIGFDTDNPTIDSSPGTERTIQHSYSQTIIAEIPILGEVAGYSNDLNSLARSDTYPGDNSQIQSESLIVAINSGSDIYNISGHFKFGFKLSISAATSPTKYFKYNVTPKLYIQTGSTITLLETMSTVSGTANFGTGLLELIIPFTEYSIEFEQNNMPISDNGVIRLYMKFDEEWIIERPGIGGEYEANIFKECFVNEDYSVDEKSFIEVSQESTTTDSTAQAFAIFETGAQIARVITDQTDSFRSNIFGRKNSEPYSYNSNGCASFCSFLNGFMVRGFPITGDNSRSIRMSMNDFFKGLNPIWNLGLGIEKVGDIYYIVVDGKDYFYDASTIMLTIDNIPNLKRSEAIEYYYNLINVGYENWETQFSNGLDEFNSKRQFDTLNSFVNNPLELISELDASGYRLEITRRKQYSDTFTEDSEYDEDNFIICLNRTEVSGLPTMLNVAEKDENFDGVSNVISPETSYNLRISPERNYVRWSNVIDSGLTKYPATEAKFTSGQGNYKMTSKVTGDNCPGSWNNETLSAGQNLQWDDVNNLDSNPIWLPEILEFQYPITWTQYKAIAANPKGVFEVSDSDTGHIKAFILEFKYKPGDVSDFKLLRAFE